MPGLKRFESISEKWFSNSSPSFDCSSSTSSDLDFRDSFHMLTQRVRYNMKRIWKIEHTIDIMDSDFTELSADYWSPHLRMVVIEISREFRCSVSKKLRKTFLRHGADKHSVSTKFSFFGKQTSPKTAVTSASDATVVESTQEKFEYSSNCRDSKTIAQKLKLDSGIETAQTANNTNKIDKEKRSYLQWFSQLVKMHFIDATNCTHDASKVSSSVMKTCPIIDDEIFDANLGLFEMIRLDPLGLQLTIESIHTEVEQSPFPLSATETATMVMSEHEYLGTDTKKPSMMGSHLPKLKH